MRIKCRKKRPAPPESRQTFQDQIREMSFEAMAKSETNLYSIVQKAICDKAQEVPASIEKFQ